MIKRILSLTLLLSIYFVSAWSCASEKVYSNSKFILNFPSKLVVDPIRKSIFISDSGHNRIIETDLSGQIKQIIGSGKKGYKEGSFKNVEFSNPQGLDIVGDSLYVADLGNQRIRELNLLENKSYLIAGNGTINPSVNISGYGLDVGLNSPTGVLRLANQLFIAMYEANQVWILDLLSKKVSVYAGSSLKGLVDGSLRRSSLTTPASLTSDGENLFLTEVLNGSVREISLKRNGRVRTIIGQSDLESGDRVGHLKDALLKQPKDITHGDNKLYVVDSLNHKVKGLDLTKKIAYIVAGYGGVGDRDGALTQALFNEPQGIDYFDQKIFLADTNNHKIKVIDLKSKQVNTLKLKQKETFKFDFKNFIGDRVLYERNVSAQINDLSINLILPPNHVILEEAKPYIKIFSKKEGIIRKKNIKGVDNVIQLGRIIKEDKVFAELALYYCRKGEQGICLIRNVLFEFVLDPKLPAEDIFLTFNLPEDY